jgi:hypothetical protein
MEEAPENGKELLHSAHAIGMNGRNMGFVSLSWISQLWNLWLAGCWFHPQKLNKKTHTGSKHCSVLLWAVDGFVHVIQLCVMNIKCSCIGNVLKVKCLPKQCSQNSGRFSWNGISDGHRTQREMHSTETWCWYLIRSQGKEAATKLIKLQPHKRKAVRCPVLPGSEREFVTPYVLGNLCLYVWQRGRLLL